MGWGDEIMVTGEARALHQRDPSRKVRVLDKNGSPRWHEMWQGNPHIEYSNAPSGAVQTLVNGPGIRPYHTGKTAERYSFNLSYRPEIGEIYLTQPERQFAAKHRPQVVIQPKVKRKASPNKHWGDDNWREFIRLARIEGLELVELGTANCRDMVPLIETASFRLGCAVLANARAYVGHESGLHHAAAAFGIPGVVIFGGYTPVELTGYPMHRNIGVSLGDACGARFPCEHCRAWMASITPERVLGDLLVVLRG